MTHIREVISINYKLINTALVGNVWFTLSYFIMGIFNPCDVPMSIIRYYTLIFSENGVLNIYIK